MNARNNQLRPSKKKKLRYLTVEEEARLMVELDPATAKNDELKAERADVRDFVIVLLDTGARYSEVAKLRYDDIDLGNSTINLWRNKVDNESRLYMTDRVYEVLARRHGRKRTKQIYVFENSDEDGPRKYAPKAFMNACEGAGIEEITLHSMRRTQASCLVQAGMPVYDVSKLLGHASVTTAANHYAHLAPNQSSRAATDILNRLGVG